MKKIILSLWFIVYGLWSFVYAQDETLTLLTYYPAPYGVYNDLEARNRLTVRGTRMEHSNNDALIDASFYWYVGIETGADTDVFSYPATPTMTLTNTSRLGIGTNDPGGPLEISSTTDNIIRLRQKEANDPWNYIEWYNSTNRRWWTGMDNLGNFRISRDNATGNILIMPGTGNVGIGIDTPNTNLKIYENNTNTVPALEIEQASTGDSAIQFNSDGNEFTIGIDSSDSDKFKISDNTSLGTNDRLTIDSTGIVSFTNMPGIAYKNYFVENHASQGSTWSDFDSLTINIPASGYVLVGVSGGEAYTYNFPIEGGLQLSVGIAESSNGVPPAGASTKISWAGNINFDTSYSVSRVYSVSAGAKTFYIVGKIDNGPKRLQLTGSIHAIYFPVEYN